MQKRSSFAPFPKVFIPLVHRGPGLAALKLAHYFDAQIILVGVVRVASGQSLSHSAAAARDLRRQLRHYGKAARVVSKTKIIVSHQPWPEVVATLLAEDPDYLMCLEWEAHFTALGMTPSEVLLHTPCNVALLRGQVAQRPHHILLPVRGGPHAELALRVGLGLQATDLTTLHIRRPDDPEAGSDAPFKGLSRVLAQLPAVQKEFAVTADAAALILERARQSDMVILGATAQPISSAVSLGPVADQVLREFPGAVIAVKSRHPIPAAYDESVGTQAISLLVDKWFAENTFHADEFKQLEELVALKREQGLTISLALPALNEAKTVGKVIRTIKRALLERTPLLDEIVLIDSNSTDRTRDIAARLGVPVHIHQHLLPELGTRRGKGEALWKSLLVTKGDLVVWVDTDIVNIHPRFVYGILGPLLLHQNVQLVKGFYRRPLRIGDKVQAGGGGRVTELTARPLLNLFYPELSGVVQPLSGEYAGRRTALEQLSFFSGYGVETGLLIDVLEKYGINAIAQVDLLERVHHNQPLEALSKMSFAIIQAVMRKLERRLGQALLDDVNKTMKLIRHDHSGYYLDVEEIAEKERPPIITLDTYRQFRR